MINWNLRAEQNYNQLCKNVYPGRGIVVGTSDEGLCVVQIYWIMGRSEKSRNRVFECDPRTGRVWTALADPTKAKDEDLSLIIYNAMLEDRANRTYVVSNGDHTKHFLELAASALGDLQYEPDRPNFTPRIVGGYNADGVTMLGMIRKSPWDDSREVHLHGYEKLPPGIGMCFHTYADDGDPLPSFRSEPYCVPIGGDIDLMGHLYWEALHPENRVALAVKFINKDTGHSMIQLKNKYEKIPA